MQSPNSKVCFPKRAFARMNTWRLLLASSLALSVFQALPMRAAEGLGGSNSKESKSAASQQTSSPKTEAALSLVKIGSSPAASSAALFLAEDFGYYRDEGLRVEFQIFSGSTAPMVPLLARGELDVGGGNLTAGLFAAAEEKIEVLIVADKGSVRKNAQYSKLMVREDLVASGQYKSPRDLKGLRIGLTATGTSQEAALGVILKSAGLKPQDVSLTKVSYADANRGFEAKNLDAAMQIEPYVAEALKAKSARDVVSVFDVVPNHQSAAIFYSPKFAAEKTEISKKFMRAYVRACRAYNEALEAGPQSAEFQKVIESLMKWTTVKDREVYARMQPAGLERNCRLNMGSLKDDAAYYVSQGYLKSMPDLGRIAPSRYVDEAVADLDRKPKRPSKASVEPPSAAKTSKRR
ncbi:MAG TPA: ABC transporter substrate-binding protein [Pseudobdellovibrionaceae bacterium]|nr:ABC transporter substrate-binding protein [Pseudobdellovibrionaceae bacterium]